MSNKYFGFLGGVSNGSFSKKSTRNSEKDKVLTFYESKMNSGELIPNVEFSQHEQAEGIFFYEKGIKIFMPNEEISTGNKVPTSSFKNLNRPFTVKVIGVDREQGVVTVSFTKAQEEVRPSVVRSIDEQLEKGNYFFTEARVLHIKSDRINKTRSHAILDIMGVGLGGILLNKDWSGAFVRDLSEEIKNGDVIDVAVVEKLPDVKSYVRYRCSRRVLDGESRWSGIEERYPLHSNIVVTCVKKEKQYWLGRVKGLDDITVYAHYPEPGTINSITGSQLIVVEGVSYMCYVSAISEKEQKLRVRCKDVLPAYMQKNTEE